MSGPTPELVEAQRVLAGAIAEAVPSWEPGGINAHIAARHLRSIVRATVSLWEEELADEIGERWLRAKLFRLSMSQRYGGEMVNFRSAAIGDDTFDVIELLSLLSPSTTEPGK